MAVPRAAADDWSDSEVDDVNYSVDAEAAEANEPMARLHPGWSEAVHAELCDLSAALQSKAAELARREANLAKDEGIVRSLIQKEADRLLSDGQDKLSASCWLQPRAGSARRRRICRGTAADEHRP